MTSTHHREVDNASPAFDGLTGASQAGFDASLVISSVDSGVPNATDATITWTTSVAANSAVFWGLTAAYAGASSPVVSATYETSHSIQITGLITATTYHYKVLSRIPTGAYAQSADGTFITA